MESVPLGFSSLGLHNRLLEVAVVAGVDDETDLYARKFQPEDFDDGCSDLFDQNWKPFLLDIIAGPQDSDGKYIDPGSLKKSVDFNSIRQSLKKSDHLQGNRQKSRKAVQRHKSIQKLRKKANKNEEVPVSTDFLRNLPFICLPDDSKVYKQFHPTSIHHTVLTDIGGYRHYAAVLTFYREFYAYKGSKNHWELFKNLKSSQIRDSENGIQCFVPCCVCLVSQMPYFDTMKDCLSCLYKEVMLSPKSGFRGVIEKYVTNLSLIVSPSPFINMRFNLGAFPVVLFSSNNALKPQNLMDFDLRIPLFIFINEPDLLFKVLACIMLEQRIVFLSESYSLLTMCIQALLCFVKPFEWPHQYIPVLFSEIIDFVDCPGIFLMGCHSRHKLQIEQVENDLHIVDLDNARVYQKEGSEKHSSSSPTGTQYVLQLPQSAKERIIRRLPSLGLYRTLEDLHVPTSVTLDEIRESQINSRLQLNSKIAEAFLDLMVDLFGSSLFYLNYETQQFRMNEYLESLTQSELPFYLKVVKTYLFRRFISERLKHEQDDFSVCADERYSRRNTNEILERRNRKKVRSLEILQPDNVYGTKIDIPMKISQTTVNFRSNTSSDIFVGSFTNSATFGHLSHNQGFTSPSSARHRSLPNENDIFDGETPKCPRAQVTLALPTFPVQGTNFNSKHFFRRCIEMINEAMRKVENENNNYSMAEINLTISTVRAGLLLMRGFYKLAEGKLLAGLEDLHATAKEDAKVFPEKLICEVMGKLTTRELQAVRNCSFYIGDNFYKKDVSHGTRSRSARMDSFFSEHDLPLVPLDENAFSKLVEKCDIATETNVISNLYKALSQPLSDQKIVEADVFVSFYQTWKQSIQDCELARPSIFRDLIKSEGGSMKMRNIGDTQLKAGRNEQILKVSAVVNSGKGMGRLILTTSRVIFLSSTNQEIKLVIDLLKLIHIKPTKFKQFISSVSGISIFYKVYETSTHFKVGLKTDCDLWIHLINEMKTGNLLTKGYHDNLSSILPPAAKSVLVADALNTTARDEGEDFLRPADVLYWVKRICNLEYLVESGQLQTLTRETEEMLLLRIDPSPKESNKSEVVDIIYSAAVIDKVPRVWVGLASGRVRTIDTTQWTLNPIPIHDWKSELKCLGLVRHTELWVGVNDNTVNCINTHDMKKSRILHDHTSPVVSIISLPSFVVTASENGQIILWENETTKVQRKLEIVNNPDKLIHVLMINDTTLCCCSESCVKICDLHGNIVQVFAVSNESTNRHVLTYVTYDGDKEIWASDSKGMIYMWNLSDTSSNVKTRGGFSSRFSRNKSSDNLQNILPTCVGMLPQDSTQNKRTITAMIYHNKKLWVGNSIGEIHILSTENISQEKLLKAHLGPVTCFCKIENRYILSGSGSKDCKIVAWRI